MTVKEVYEQAQKLSPNERRDLAKLLLDSLPLAEDELESKRKAALAELIDMAKELQTIEPALSQEEIDAELRAYYADKAKEQSTV